MTEEEDQCMDWAVGCTDEPEAAAPMGARSSRCRRSTAGMRGAGTAIGTGLGLKSFADD